MYAGLHVRCPLFLSDFSQTWIFSAQFRKIMKYQISWKSSQWGQNCSLRTDGRTDVKNLMVTFRNFAKALKNETKMWFVEIKMCFTFPSRYSLTWISCKQTSSLIQYPRAGKLKSGRLHDASFSSVTKEVKCMLFPRPYPALPVHTLFNCVSVASMLIWGENNDILSWKFVFYVTIFYVTFISREKYNWHVLR
jgi:hypothetical protein